MKDWVERQTEVFDKINGKLKAQLKEAIEVIDKACRELDVSIPLYRASVENVHKILTDFLTKHKKGGE